MTRAFLIQPPIEDFYTTPIRLYPLGLLYVAAVLKASGIDVAILDGLSPLKKRPLQVPQAFSYLEPYLKNPLFFRGYYRFGMSDAAIAEAAESFRPDWIGISAQFTAYYSSVHRLASLLKSRMSAPIVLGGNHATVFSDEIRRRTPAVDFILKGPAEAGLLDLLRSETIIPTYASTSQGLAAGKETVEKREKTGERFPSSRLEQTVQPPFRSPDKVKGVGDRTKFEHSPDDKKRVRARLFVDWRGIHPPHALLDPDRYRIGKKRYISLTASRGCPYRCEFCSVHRMFGRKIEYRPVDSVLEEMRRNALQRGIRIFNFEDDNLSFDRKWFLDLLRSVAAAGELEGVELTAMNGLCSPTLDEEVLAAMAKAGFRQINISYVTRDASLRDNYKRPRAEARFEDVVRAAQARGLFVTAYVIIGLPGQTYAEIKESIDYLLGLDVLVGPSVFYLPPGSGLYDKVRVAPHVKDNWDFHRSSAFAVETEGLTRSDLIELFLYARRRNLEKKLSPLA